MKVTQSSLVQQLQMLKDAQQIERPSQIPQGVPGQAGQTQTSFAEVLMNKYEETNQLGIDAEQAIQRSISGKSENPHEAIIAVQKASVSLSLMMGIKERLERAYQEIIRTPI